MKSLFMKKIFLFLAFALTASVANAWIKQCDEAVVILAVEHLNPEAKMIVEKYLGNNYADDIKYLYTLEKEDKATHSEEIHFLHLDKSYKPVKAGSNDAIAALEKAMAVVRAHEKQSHKKVVTALRTMIDLMCDIHDLGNIRIKGIEHSYNDFTYQVPLAEYGKKKDKFSKHKWSESWNNYGGYPRGFSPQYRAYDMKIYLGDRYEEYTKGNLRDWAAENGAIAAKWLEICKPDCTVSFMDRKLMEDVSYTLLVKSSCRLAALLNRLTE